LFSLREEGHHRFERHQREERQLLEHQQRELLGGNLQPFTTE
jgi:hypothetical protein